MAITLDGTSGITSPDVTSDGLTVDSTTLVVDETNNRVGIGTSSPGSTLNLEAATCTIRLKDTGASDYALIGTDDDGSLSLYARTAAGVVDFRTNNTERMRIDSSGALLVGTTSAPGAATGGANIAPVSDGAQLQLSRTSTLSRTQVVFYNGNGAVGSIVTNGSATAYNTSSDYRLKENIAPMTGALNKVIALKPCTYIWKVDGSAGEGFIAHELQAVLPDCVSGEKDAVDDDGNPVYQGVDTSFLVATLTAAIQELSAKNDALEARIAALEGAQA